MKNWRVYILISCKFFVKEEPCQNSPVALVSKWEASTFFTALRQFCANMLSRLSCSETILLFLKVVKIQMPLKRLRKFLPRLNLPWSINFKTCTIFSHCFVDLWVNWELNIKTLRFLEFSSFNSDGLEIQQWNGDERSYSMFQEVNLKGRLRSWRQW